MSKIEKFFYLLVPLLVLGIPLHYSVVPLCLAMLVLRCVTSEHTTVAVFLMIYAGPTIGCIRAVYPFLPVYGAVFSLLGFLMVIKEFEGFFQKNLSGIISLVLVFAYFYLSLIDGGNTEYGQEKYAGIVSNGVSALVGFYIFFTSRKVNNEQFAQMLLITSIFMVEYLVTLFGFQAGGLFDYNWIRESLTLNDPKSENVIIGYQHIGMNIAFAYGIFMSSKVLNKKRMLYYSIICFHFAMMSGARQALLASVIVLVLRMAIIGNAEKSKFSIKGIVFVIATVFILYNLIMAMNIEVIKNTFENGDAGREILKEQALAIFANNQLFGSGLGEFFMNTGQYYPHNFFLEVLCECGIVGFCFLSTVCLVFIQIHRIGIKQMTGNDSFFFVIMISLFIRCMVSGNFTLSIQLFSALFALASLSNKKSNFKDRVYDI